MKCARYGLIAILLSIVVLPLSAMAVPLDGPIPPIRQDGLLFSNFSAELFTYSMNSSPQALSEIDVSGITVNGESGLRIGAVFFAPTNAGNSSGALLLLEFDVMVMNPHGAIHGVTLASDVFANGTATRVSASAGPASVFASPPSDDEPFMGSLRDARVLDSDVRRLHIDTSFEVLSDGIPGGAGAGGFDVTFAQSVAEPSIVLLLVFGAVLITAMAHKVRQA